MIISERVILRDEVRMREVLHTLRDGGVIIYPSETVYVLGGALSSARATETIFSLKARDSRDALFAIVFDFRQAEAFANIRFDLEKRLFEEFGNCGLTVLLDARPFVASAPRGGGSTLGIRLATTELTKILTERVAEPLTSIIANLSNNLIPRMDEGEILPETLEDIPEALLKKVDLVIDAEAPPKGGLTTIVRVEAENRIVLHRQGVLTLREIERMGIHIETA